MTWENKHLFFNVNHSKPVRKARRDSLFPDQSITGHAWLPELAMDAMLFRGL
jgi:hypothetical protein